MVTEETDVVIVGAGLAGLSTAVFLGLHGVRALVIERHPSTSILPKARGQNPVTMEALRVAGLTDAIRAAIPPGKPGITSVISESMTGRVFYDHVANRPDFSLFSPERPGMASQARAETALADRALALGAEIRFNQRVTALVQDAEGVTLTVQSLQSDEQTRLRARYVVAADGLRGEISGWLGITTHGIGFLKSVSAVRFTADLLPIAGDNAMVVHYIQNDDVPDGAGVLVSTDYVGEWVANISADPDRDDAETARIIRTMVGVPDLELTILGGTTYDYTHRIADRFRNGRVFLAGDAAHVMPPTGGQGGNAAVQDGYYLGWKLAAVLRGLAAPALLESYETERKPYTEEVCNWQTANLADRRAMDGLAEKIGEPMDHATMMFGYVCPDGAFVREADHPVEIFEDPHTPSGRPGARVPYRKLAGLPGDVSTRELLGPHFLAFTGAADGAARAEAAAKALGVPLKAYPVASVAALGAQARDTVLVRPDGVVAWRGADPGGAADALRVVLHR